MSDYYPQPPWRRFWFMRGRLEVAGHASSTPDEAGVVYDADLYERHMDAAASANEADLSDDEDQVKGFLFGEEPQLTATARSVVGPKSDAKSALERWAVEQDFEKPKFDSSWE